MLSRRGCRLNGLNCGREIPRHSLTEYLSRTDTGTDLFERANRAKTYCGWLGVGTHTKTQAIVLFQPRSSDLWYTRAL